jgi:RNA polymerase sigma factor (TIGR02999 family)
MPEQPPEKLTKCLTAAVAGDESAAAQLTDSVYAELRDLAGRYLRRERVGHSLQPTGLVHEAFLRLVDQQDVDWQGRTHFLAVAAQTMRRVLVDHARRHKRVKRGGGRRPLSLDEGLVIHRDCDEDVLVVNDVLEQLAKLDPRQATIVELRFFGGLTVDEVASALGISQRTVEREWTMARAWLRRRLSEEDDS